MRKETVKQTVCAVLESLDCTYSKIRENDILLVYRLRDIWTNDAMYICINHKSNCYTFSYDQYASNDLLYVTFKNNRQLIIYLVRDIVTIWKRGKRK